MKDAAQTHAKIELIYENIAKLTNIKDNVFVEGQVLPSCKSMIPLKNLAGHINLKSIKNSKGNTFEECCVELNNMYVKMLDGFIEQQKIEKDRL